MGAQLGFEPGHIEDSAAYIASWLEVLRNDKRAIVRAAAAGQRAADYLMEAARFSERLIPFPGVNPKDKKSIINFLEEFPPYNLQKI